MEVIFLTTSYVSTIEYVINRQKEETLTYLQQHPDFSPDLAAKVHKFQSTHEKYTQTPLVSLKNLAKCIGVKSFYIKNEAKRFGLNAFKVLGGIYAIGRYLADRLNRDIETLSFEELRTPEVKKELGTLTFVSATDGNHGKGVAWAARELGQRAVIYLPKGAAKERVEAIANEGAIAEVTDLNYDGAVQLAAQKAKENGWVVVQDTAWEGYEEIPLWIMQGYATLAKEIVDQLEEDEFPTHIFLQAGVGSYAASIAAYFKQFYHDKQILIGLVEPHLANCYYRSFVANEIDYKIVEGEMNTIMAGLSCGVPNPQAWEILRRYTDISFSCDDSVAALGMRLLGQPIGDDERIISGESGAVTTGLAYCLATEEHLQDLKEQLQINENSRILVISTEGDTDQENYRNVVWKGSYPYQPIFK